MALTITTKPASTKQINWIRDLAAEKTGWMDHVPGTVADTIMDILGNVNNPDPKFIALTEASQAIGALLKYKPAKPVVTTTAITAFSRLQLLLGALKPGYYALPRPGDPGTFNFYRIVEIEKGAWKGRRFVNQLVGSPGGWDRIKPKMDAQLQIARQIAVDADGAAKLYAEKHTRCCRCNSDLSHPRSQVALIGEKCAGIWGWAW